MKDLISEHLLKFKKLFPEQNILPKHHLLGQWLERTSCFSFEDFEDFGDSKENSNSHPYFIMWCFA